MAYRCNITLNDYLMLIFVFSMNLHQFHTAILGGIFT